MAETVAISPLRVSDVAERYNITSSAVRKWITQGLGGSYLKASRAGSSGMFYIEEADLEDFMTSNRKPDNPQR